MSAAADEAVDLPPPLPPVVLPPPPMMDDAAAAAEFVAADVPVADTNATAEPILLQEASEGLINFEYIITELQSWQSENNGSLAIPSSHPVS